MASKSSKTNLDLNNLHLLNLPARLFIALLAVAAVLGLGYAGLFKSQMESLEEYEAKETELKNTYKQKSIDAASLNNLRDELLCLRYHVETAADRCRNSQSGSRASSGRFEQRPALGQRYAPTSRR